MTEATTETTLSEFKYLVAWSDKLGQYKIGYTRKFSFHFQILATFGGDFLPVSGGYFNIAGDDVNTIKVYGKSSGFDVVPGPLDVEMLKLHMNRDDFVDTFDGAGFPL